MKIETYFDEARKTAIYPGSARIYYPFFGLFGEFGEFLEKIVIGANAENLTLEAGDCYWYVANMVLDMGYSSGDFAAYFGCCNDSNFDEILTDYRITSTESIFIRLSKIAEILKKFIRDGEVTFDKFETVFRGVCEAFRDLLILMRRNGICPERAAVMNIAKLKSRQQRGKLQGSGDNR